ncbi:hypothetical protein EN858_14960 [Mesorhizobium sp. M4B.F.Ca.ET.215.01.1.1]|uniref:helix-turn-helix domain-containing protein n=1 Tax=unclassified Mesorhizobium TaxID=325217 RepID=UPI00109391CB|nr:MULTISPECIES: helix-turn-helix domain-containing protein [unclassified Mesorhizobium]TGQ11220.1 hypothetical protein EN858_14960 [Mesorhizobium sp. M4B.F.Ca.ET.215.01.1.1]TGR04727.1 hypothetical protein EN846_13120 [Mesorhizobium sp. M4B.F.Ca.ET.203.01.1.1]
MAKPTEISIEDARAMSASGDSLRVIAAKLGCSPQTVSRRLLGKDHISIPRPQNPVDAWSDEKKANVRARYAEGWSRRDLAKKLHVTEGQLRPLLSETQPNVSHAEKVGFAVKKHFYAGVNDAAACRFGTKAHEIEEL